jgi:retinol dehydrogenase 14
MAQTMPDARPMAGKAVLVTGGTGGIGKATAIGLAGLGARVGITGRDLARAERAAADIRTASGNPAIDVFAADMSSQAEVRRLAGAVLDAYPRLEVLVNNVGGFWAHQHTTADGLERTFALNHLAPFLLTNLLLDRLKASAPARIVNVSSHVQAEGRIEFDDLQGTRNYSAQRAYSQSKLANVLFTNELARRLKGTGVTATAVHPGFVRTDFGSEDQAWFFTVISSLVRPFLKTPAHGAQSSIYLASSVDVEGVSGQFFVNGRPKAANKVAYDPDIAGQLWRVSADLVGMTSAIA